MRVVSNRGGYEMHRYAKVLLSLSTCYLLTVAAAQTAQPLSNSGFEKGLDGWGTRTTTEGVYTVLSPGFEGDKYVELKVSQGSPQRDRGAVYFNRRDLPVAPGYYQLHFAARSDLQNGSAGARIVSFDADGKVLLSSSPGATGIPVISGKTDWTDYDYIYNVPQKTTMTVIQLELNNGIGTVDFDKVRIEKLDDATGKKLMSEQKNRVVIPPFKPVPDRTLQNPLKTQKMIFTDAAVKLARENIARYPQAKALEENILKAADPWLQWSDEDLRDLLPSAQVPRAFDLNVHGCPVHGDAIFNKGGAYPWILDPRHPFQVECPIGHEKYPSNDFVKYMKSGFKDRAGMDQKYADDGWGWLDPETGERYWFVAYANQWNWNRTIGPAILNLSRAYVLTGDKKYAHKAAVMLYRLAQVYPSMDNDNQSRYGLMMHAQGGHYPGKVLNAIWETRFAQDFAEDYDAVWDTIDGDAALQKLYGKNGGQIRSYIEANLLEDAIDAYFKNQIRGNFGMHQSALLYVLLARQNVDLQKYFHLLVDEPGTDVSHTGLRYALYDQVWRDGLGYESPGYNQLWISNFATLSHLLKQGGFNLFDDPKLKMLFDGPLKLTVIGETTPTIGDSGSVVSGIVGRDSNIYQIAYNAYHNPDYLPWIASINRTGADGFSTFDSLFLPMLPETKPLPDGRATAPEPSRLFAGYGVGILNNPQDTAALALTYGKHISHFHWDFLNFDLYANGQKMMPDLGYPDAMNAFVSEIYTWSHNTVAHNTVVVDAGKQPDNLPGVLHDFANAPFARSIDASSPAYPQTTQYRRNMIMVDADPAQSYVVDVFRVDGGKEHDYSLHGPPGTVTTLDGSWSAPAPGTLAGPDVKWGEMYDDAKLAAKDYKGSYGGYAGSGFQYLFNVQQLQSGNSELQYAHVKDAKAQLRIHLLPYKEQKVYMADAYDLPRKKSYIVKYLIARRQSTDDKPLKSTFVSVLETYNGAPFITKTQTLHLDKGNGVAVEVQRQKASDIILSDPSSSIKVLSQYGIETDAASAVVTLNSSGDATRVFFSGGTYLSYKGKRYTAKAITGKVLSVDPAAQTVTIQLDQLTQLSADEIAQRVAHFSNAFHDSVHPLASAALQGNQLTLKTQDALLVGRLRLSGGTDKILTTDTALPLSQTYNGTALLDGNYRAISPVEKVGDGEITLPKSINNIPAKGSDAWLSDVGIGDQVKINSLFYVTGEN